MDIKKIIRKSCIGFEPYVAGKPVETLKRELGIKNIVKLASNENPLGPSPKAIKAIKDNLNKIFFYPDSNSYELKKALSERYRLPVGNIFTGAGGDEIIELVAKLFFNSSDEIVISKHAFIRYAMAVQLMGSKAVIVPMKDGYSHDLKAMFKAVTPKTKAVFITNPNNPTGTYNTKAELSAFLKALPKNSNGVKPLVILDEAYFEYAKLKKDYPDGLEFLKDNPNLIVFRTFSKVYALAGLRVGYGFANEVVVDFIERTRPPFNVNLLAQAAAVASIKDGAQVKKGQTLAKKEKEYLYKEFKKLGVKYLDSAANFILFNSSPLKGKELFAKMLGEGVITRAMDEYELSSWVRVTVGLHKENELFVKKLKKIMGK
ncbi:histidinol-phosphate transaminase [Endomicrobium proavitum]|uniref:Histidinol-phosphate aminotransferase n=1 Tax=Endomicrobium proavitum TaxID=1408281 RepID=A0A0G3WL85_9BACT|nr:histidinol-phosphate transaminase [Endomicrobium proavitum]AKL98650.1 Histidinol-phosphate aminotransferase [Endomicrobium proavitum]